MLLCVGYSPWDSSLELTKWHPRLCKYWKNALTELSLGGYQRYWLTIFFFKFPVEVALA